MKEEIYRMLLNAQAGDKIALEALTLQNRSGQL